jgi:hemoglobin-like flavoprotein
MALHSNQIKLVRDSFQLLRPQSDAVAEAFYNRLFELEPNLKLLFHGDMGEQGSKLMVAIGAVVENLDRFHEVEPTLQELAVRHVGYGVKIGDYEAVGGALLWAIERTLLPNFPPETKIAWAATYLSLSTVMKDAATAAAKPCSL